MPARSPSPVEGSQCARSRHICDDGSDTGNASAFNHGRWHGKEAELLVKEVGMPPMEAIVANTSSNAWLMGLEGGSA
jgi:imidazolonepropionase-like amidohydrolase